MKPITKDQRIVNALLLNGSFINNLGLMNGKMGIAIYFFHLTRQTNDQIYEGYAGELIDEIYEEITSYTAVDFENGLAGIGWGIEYLVQNGFIDADINEALADLDRALAHELVHHCPESISLLNGLMGLGAYFLVRISGKNKPGPKEIENKQALIYCIDLLDQRLTSAEIEKLLTGDTDRKRGPAQLGTRNPQYAGFDLAWDYFILLWFMGELYESDVFNAKTIKIINRLVKPLSDDGNIPQSHYRRLLLELGAQKLVRSGIDNSLIACEIAINGISGELLTKTDHLQMRTQLKLMGTSITTGISGLAWCYYQLHKFTMGDSYLGHSEYWQEQLELVNQEDDWLVGIDLETAHHGFGILGGLAGVGLTQLLVGQFNHKTI